MAKFNKRERTIRKLEIEVNKEKEIRKELEVAIRMERQARGELGRRVEHLLTILARTNNDYAHAEASSNKFHNIYVE